MSTSRITARFAELKAQDRAAFVSYVMAGDPDADTALEIVRRLPSAGVDIIEIGFPFSDPMADGPSIQASALRSLAGGGSLGATLDLVAAFREEDNDTPIILMGYLNPILTWGVAEFSRSAAAVGADGLIIVDLPPEEADPFVDEFLRHELSLIFLATPTSDNARLAQIVKRGSGFIYYVAVAGVTGGKEADEAAVAPAIARLSDVTDLPVVVGFGIKTPERAAAIGRVASGVVVGSALVDTLAGALNQGSSVTDAVVSNAAVLSRSVREARKG